MVTTLSRVAYIYADVILLLFGMLSGGEFEHSALRSPLRLSLSPLSSNTTTIEKLIRPRGGQGIRAWNLRTH